MLITRASLPVEPEGVPLGPLGVVAATLEVGGTRAMGMAGVTVDLEDMDTDIEGPATMVAEARVHLLTGILAFLPSPNSCLNV
ncbi:hypothetical protein MC885_020582 [Smutsia gigantea]|nr:hypothetical protein MC885_020582 [Smutsia gigantea]